MKFKIWKKKNRTDPAQRQEKKWKRKKKESLYTARVGLRVIPDTINDFMTIVGNDAVLILGCKQSPPRRAPQFLLFHVAAEPEPSEFLFAFEYLRLLTIGERKERFYSEIHSEFNASTTLKKVV